MHLSVFIYRRWNPVLITDVFCQAYFIQKLIRMHMRFLKFQDYFTKPFPHSKRFSEGSEWSMTSFFPLDKKRRRRANKRTSVSQSQSVRRLSACLTRNAARCTLRCIAKTDDRGGQICKRDDSSCCTEMCKLIREWLREMCDCDTPVYLFYPLFPFLSNAEKLFPHHSLLSDSSFVNLHIRVRTTVASQQPVNTGLVMSSWMLNVFQTVNKLLCSCRPTLLISLHKDGFVE